MIRLSICIATLNRVAFIGATLESFLGQMTDEVELVIVDGASTDGTDVVIRSLFEDRPNCFFLRLDKKGGVDQDYNRAALEAKGDYCWLMTDDDLLVPDAIATVLAKLRDDPDLLIVNADVNNADFSVVLTPRKCPVPSDRDLAPNQQSELMAAAGELTSFIGSVIIRRSVWLARDRESYFGTEFAHVGVIFQRPFERHVRIIARPLVRIRYGNALWTDRGFDIWMFKWPKLIWSFPHISDAAKQAVTPREPWRIANRIVMMKTRGNYTYATYRKSLAPLDLGWLLRLEAILIAVFPNVLYNAAMCLLVAPLMTWDKTIEVELQKSRFYYRKCWFGRP